MSDPRDAFDDRVNRLYLKRKKAARTSRETFIDKDGYVVVRGQSRSRRLPTTGLLLLIMGFVSLKGLMIAQLGTESYAARISQLFDSDSLITKIGAWTMQGDAVSVLIADGIQRLL